MAGATIEWDGGTSTDVSVGANWVGGNVPASGDFAIWKKITVYAPVSGSWTNAVAKFEATEGAGHGSGGSISRDIGSASTPLTLSAIATSCRFGNRGNVYVTSTGTVAAASFEMGSGFTATLTGGTWTAPLAVVGTKGVIGASAIVTNLRGNGGSWEAEANGTGFTSVTLENCPLRTARAITAGNVVGRDARLTVTGAAAVTAVNIRGGAKYYHQSSGNTTAEIFPGSYFSPEGNPYTGGAAPTATITKWTGAYATLSANGVTLAGTITPYGPDSYPAIGGIS